jgi:hypothetical protein
MPKGPKGERRPADVIGNAVHVMRVLTGEIEERANVAKDAATLGKRGGHARAAKMTPEQRSEVARLAAAARWKKGD